MQTIIHISTNINIVIVVVVAAAVAGAAAVVVVVVVAVVVVAIVAAALLVPFRRACACVERRLKHRCCLERAMRACE